MKCVFLLGEKPYFRAVDTLFWWLKGVEVPNHQKSFSSKTYLLKSEENILGFYSISNTLIEQSQVDIRWPKHPLPAILLGRLGVHLNSQGKGIGSILFADACKKVVDIANIVGCVGLVTDAKDQSAINFYKKLGMESFKNKQNTLFLKTKTILQFLK